MNAGGGTDLAGRIYAKYLAKYLPGNPTVIVRNMPGGNATVGANFVYGAKPDGLTSLVTGGSTVQAYLTMPGAIRYDLQKMEPVVGLSEGGVFVIRPGIVDKVENFPKAKGIIYGGSTGTTGWLLVIVGNMLNMRFDRMATAYSGSGEAMRAFLSGEVNMNGVGTSTYLAQFEQYVKKGEAQPLFQIGSFDEKGNIVGDPNLSNDILAYPQMYELITGNKPSGIAWDTYVSLLAGTRSYTRIMWLPPGTPQSIVSAYWDGAKKMIADSEFRQIVAREVGEKTPWLSGKGFADAVRSKIKMDPKSLEWLKGALAEYGMVVE